MNESTTNPTREFTPAASLAAIGVQVQQLNLFGPIRQLVQIAQKTVKHAPVDKLYDALITMLAGAHGMVEINTRLRSDPALQAAFGRSACAEQLVVQETLDACTTENVQQMEQALDTIYRQHSQGFRHDYARAYQVLDVDMSGMPCGPTAAFATKGYFAKQRNRRGRQLGRVLATRYDEVVTDRLFDGKTQLTKALQPLVEAAETTLELDEAKRARTIVRLDAGGGSLHDVNWLLSRGYQVHCKDYSGQHARSLARSVDGWVDDPHVPGRQVGWVTEAPTAYVRPVRRIAVRCRQQNGQWAYGVLISTLSAVHVCEVVSQPTCRLDDPVAVLLAYVSFYDQRGGGIETAFQHVLLQCRRGHIGAEFRTAIALLGRWREDFDDHNWIDQYRACLLATSHRHICIDIAALCQLQADIAAVDHAGAIGQRTAQHPRHVRTEGSVDDAALGHVEHACVGHSPVVIEARGWAEHERVAIEVFILSVGRLIQREILIDRHVQSVAHR